MATPPKYITAILVLFITSVFSQSNSEELYNNFSSHNFLKHNRFFINPTFSVAREHNTTLSFLSRNKFTDFDDSPQLYVGSYAGRMTENVGVGIGVFQQNFGVFKNFGVLANYAYQVQISDNNALTFAFNFMYAKSGIDKSRIVTTNPDPFLNSFQERPIINFQPAVNLRLKNFDVGLFLENLVDYDLKANDFITTFSEKTFSGHLMYTIPFKNTTGFLKDGRFQSLNLFRKQANKSITYSGSLMLDLPKFGWLQTTYDDFYGTAFGFGVNLSERIAIGFVYEKGKNNLGVTNEISITYSFGAKNYAQNKEAIQQEKIEKLTDSLKIKEKQTAKIIADYKREQDSINKAKEIESKKKHVQLLHLIKNNQQQKKTEIVSNKKKETIPEKKQVQKTAPIYTTKKRGDLASTLKPTTGFYVVANYFSVHRNAQNFVKTLKNQGYNAAYVQHPKNKYYYVYLDRFETLTEARAAKKSKLNNSYQKALSVVKIVKNKLQTLVIEKKQPTKVKTSAVKKKFVKKKVRITKLKRSGGLAPGYYFIVNVFSKEHYAEQFIKKLKKQGLQPQFFIYPKNKYRYVYLAKKNTKQEALELYHSNLNGNYTNDKWIMHIE
ncbi:MAG: PorP/SprF family type IX secretion system membrane protein [Flavobacteriaceae bacterium]|nr:PorP/SprF family type IX secretion system membrane protein [Flavobacteriaceae bacterium]